MDIGDFIIFRSNVVYHVALPYPTDKELCEEKYQMLQIRKSIDLRFSFNKKN